MVSFSYYIEISELIVFVDGGNRLQGYADPLILEGVVNDIDSLTLNGLSYIWTCLDLKTNGACKTILGDIITLENVPSNSFQAKIFEPYSTFMFFLEG
jgi:hypothetical protein